MIIVTECKSVKDEKRAMRIGMDNERQWKNRLQILDRCRCLGTRGCELGNYEVMVRDRDP